MRIIVPFIYAFLYIPIVVLVIFSFNYAPFPAPWSGATLHWYFELMHAHQLWRALYTSFTVAVSATLISCALSLALVYYCFYQPRIQRLIFLFYGSLVIPEVVLAVGLLSFFTWYTIPLGMITLIIAHSVFALGYMVPLVFVRYQEIDHRLIEASLDLGASLRQTFLKVVVPLLLPTLIGAGLLVFVLSLDDFILSYFCAGGSAQTISLYILSMLRSGVSPIVNALSTVMLLVSSILVAVFCSLQVRSRMW